MTIAVRTTFGRPLIAGLTIAIVAAACSSGGGTATSPAGSPSSTPGTASPSQGAASPSPAFSTSSAPSLSAGSPAPATFALTASGDPNVAGTWTSSFGIECVNPTFTGEDILFFAASPDTKAVVLITLSPGSIEVSERAGSGSTYTERDFQGTGVSTFDPATGAAFDSTLTEVPQPGGKPGTLGTIKRVTGSVDCAGQTAGTSTIVLSGASLEGVLTGPFSAFKVTCNISPSSGNSVTVSGIIMAGSTPTAMIVTLAPKGSAIFSHGTAASAQHAYSIAPAGTVSLSANGAHVDADFVEGLPKGSTATPHTIHLAGDTSCGSYRNF